jgi:uncharacterized protein YdhG (YjbR/CyaY superfamily)
MKKAYPPKAASVDAYFDTVKDPAMKAALQKLRDTIKQAVPKAEEVISYHMPAFKLNGILVYYAACKEHVGFYPTGSPIVKFKEELATYKTSKGAVQFPVEKGIPVTLVKKIVKFRAAENKEKLQRIKNKANK